MLDVNPLIIVPAIGVAVGIYFMIRAILSK